MTLEDLGYNSDLEIYRTKNGLNSFEVGRVVAEHKEKYIVKTAEKEYEAEIVGNLRYTAQSRFDFPAVGDWVAISEFDDNKTLIHAVFPRKSILERQAVGKKGEKQIIATNIDVAFILQAVDRDFSINRIERYLSICNSSKVTPIIVLNKIDLKEQSTLSQMIDNIEKRIMNVPVLAISNDSLKGIEELKNIVEERKTYCLLGSSGVGKSTLLNTLLNEQITATGTISEHSNRGRHVTTHRELHFLKNGGMIIDNPGMREVGVVDSSGGIKITFDSIIKLSKDCKFKDCSHTTEPGCAVLSAVENGKIDKNSYENYLKVQREKDHFELDLARKHQKSKSFGKILKNYKKGNFKKL